MTADCASEKRSNTKWDNMTYNDDFDGEYCFLNLYAHGMHPQVKEELPMAKADDDSHGSNTTHSSLYDTKW